MPPTPFRSGRVRVFVAALALVVFALACGEPSREAQLRDAQKELTEAEKNLEDARGEHESRAKALAEAQQAHDEARDSVRKAEARADAARSAVGLFATDDVLFRSVQKALLEDDRLREVAIAASVRDGRVTLSGEVPNARLRDRAVDLAKKIPGVADVNSEIRVIREEPPSEG
jgi:hyperosmotically inducible periplasmic protein